MGISFMTLTLPGSGPTPSEEILCPRKMISAVPSSALLGAGLRLNLANCSRNRRRSHTCCSQFLEEIVDHWKRKDWNYALLVNNFVVARQLYTSICFRHDTQGASPIRVPSVQNARQQELVNFGARESWRVAVWLLLYGSRVLFENDPEGVNGDLSQVDAVLGKPMPMLKFV